MSVSFLKRGGAMKEATDQADAQTEAKKEAAKQARRFWMPNDTEKQITFLDGDFADTGLLDVPAFWEHQVKMNGHWQNYFPCTKEFEPCPVCDSSDREASFVYAFTVINHTPFVDRAGVKHQHQKELYVCKRDTFKLLTILAKKRGGLTGCTFDVMRTGDKAPNVGSQFDFCEKRTLKEVQMAYGLDDENMQPVDYDDAFKYVSPDELRKLGFGSGPPPIGAESTAQSKVGENVDKHL